MPHPGERAGQVRICIAFMQFVFSLSIFGIHDNSVSFI
jgi:hypothetical protein